MKLVALLYLCQNVKIPVAKCKYTRKEPVTKCKIGPQGQNVTRIVIFFMLWARLNGGEKEEKGKMKEICASRSASIYSSFNKHYQSLEITKSSQAATL